jgi:hypothetical protein
VAVGVGEGIRERAFCLPGGLGQHTSHSLAVKIPEITTGEHLFKTEHFEEIEL